jgi:hypothetical protein
MPISTAGFTAQKSLMKSSVGAKELAEPTVHLSCLQLYCDKSNRQASASGLQHNQCKARKKRNISVK